MPLARLNRVLLHLDPKDQRRVLRYARWRSMIWRLPRTPLRLALLHMAVTAFALYHAPPPPEIPPIFIPITWAASFSTAIGILSLLRITRWSA